MGEVGRPVSAVVDDADGGRDGCSQVAQATAGVDDLTARGHHVLDDHQPAASNLRAFGELTGP